MTENIENKLQENEDQEMVDVNRFNDEYAPYDHPNPPKKEYPYLNFIDFEKYGVVMNNE